MPGGSMTDEQRAWLILSGAFVSDRQLSRLLDACGSVEAAVNANSATLERAIPHETHRQSILQPDESWLARAAAWLAEPGHRIVCRRSVDYPALLAQIPDPPILIYVAGSVDCLHLPALAIVGSRNPTRGGVDNADRFAAQLGAAGFCIVSGLAYGIDSAAHRGALRSKAYTIAVLGHGIDRVYPRRNSQLAGDIVAGGAVISEFPFGCPPRREYFPLRNRLISGLSLATLVVEAATRSGSLITARLAGDQGRDIFAIPGSIHNPMARGCHKLLRQGATLVETPQDIIDEVAPQLDQLMQNAHETPQPEKLNKIQDKDYKLLIDALGFDPATSDEIARNSGLTIDQVSSMLLILELEGEIESLSGGKYSRMRSNARQ
ncbi:MAG: DNA-processing protein DprA [Gammaproteobacteria bacterium]|nr:DNA-processing protein DprA [Gammaproteobacteria bacterium]